MENGKYRIVDGFFGYKKRRFVYHFDQMLQFSIFETSELPKKKQQLVSKRRQSLARLTIVYLLEHTKTKLSTIE